MISGSLQRLDKVFLFIISLVSGNCPAQSFINLHKKSAYIDVCIDLDDYREENFFLEDVLEGLLHDFPIRSEVPGIYQSL